MANKGLKRTTQRSLATLFWEVLPAAMAAPVLIVLLVLLAFAVMSFGTVFGMDPTGVDMGVVYWGSFYIAVVGIAFWVPMSFVSIVFMTMFESFRQVGEKWSKVRFAHYSFFFFVHWIICFGVLFVLGIRSDLLQLLANVALSWIPPLLTMAVYSLLLNQMRRNPQGLQSESRIGEE